MGGWKGTGTITRVSGSVIDITKDEGGEATFAGEELAVLRNQEPLTREAWLEWAAANAMQGVDCD
jgi:hypothetical protein